MTRRRILMFAAKGDAVPMKLADLDARFIKILDERTWQYEGVTLADAQGVQFLCPKCYAANSGPVGTHLVVCWFAGRGVPDDLDPKPGRWNPSGTGLHDLTFVGPGAASVWLKGDGSGCQWHGFVKDGDAS